MRSYIVTCKTSSDDLKELRIEARNHLAAAKAVTKQGFTVVSVDREDDPISQRRRRRRIKRVIFSLVVGLILATLCVALICMRYIRHG